MFEYIKGILEKKAETFAVIEVGGIGYKISTSQNSLRNIGNIGEKVVFYTYMYVREDILELYGFASPEEKSAFEMLISVSGVGPKAAINILSCVSAANLVLAIVTNDTKVITEAQGVGPKLAQRIILELKDKIKSKDLFMKNDDLASNGLQQNEAVEALVALGYSPSEAMNAMKGIDSNLSLEDTIKLALKKIIKTF